MGSCQKFLLSICRIMSSAVASARIVDGLDIDLQFFARFSEGVELCLTLCQRLTRA